MLEDDDIMIGGGRSRVKDVWSEAKGKLKRSIALLECQMT